MRSCLVDTGSHNLFEAKTMPVGRRLPIIWHVRACGAVQAFQLRELAGLALLLAHRSGREGRAKALDPCFFRQRLQLCDGECAAGACAWTV
ncbi:hypothetical protein [Paenibacillus physcomitrellae]|uniref:hypothetical protein n=1 Tax=Paenibacillus physcomitrellae TaxID=1619311 RepID=UPI0012FE16EF|nr:hypothetical protein [Paenibacillus physcomitrellae]